MKFTQALLSMFSVRFMLIPFSVRNLQIAVPGGSIGYTDYMVFGIRIARIQKTTPW